ncbi:30S ribosomal protein S21 [bacterium]|nr:30S ribosomal protein S21 [bacterium]
MSVEVKRKPKETISALVRRFSRAVQKSGILIEAKKRRFYVKKPTKRERRESALRRIKIIKEQERLKKLGLSS